MYDGHGNPSRDVGESSTFGDVTRKTEFICGDKGGGNSKLTIDHHRVTATLAVRRKLSPAINKQFPRVFVDRSVTYGRHVLVFVAFLSATRSSFRLRVLSIRYFVRVCPRHRRTRTLVVQYTVLGPGTTKTIITMASLRAESLFNLALNKLCYSMDKDTLQKILNEYPPSINLLVIWKILCIQNGNDELVLNRTLYYIETYEETFNQGCSVAHILINDFRARFFWELDDKALQRYEYANQLTFVDTFDFCKMFNYEIFFKLYEFTRRCQLYVIFQICVQTNGLDYPKKFAELWMENIKIQENGINIDHIERGMLLGIFLSECGWYCESALILSYTYKIISTKWECSDQNLKLIQSAQCLSKWLLVVINYKNFDEIEGILSRVKRIIDLLDVEGKQLNEETQLCLANAYLAVSECYYELMDYEKAWIWALKIINKLHDGSNDTLKLSVFCHFVKICPVTNRTIIGKRILEEALYTYTKEIDPKTCIDIIMNVADYQIHADLLKFSISSFLTSIGWSQYLFGYCNLYTAKLMVDYAHARFDSNFTELTDVQHAMSSVVQGIYIMRKLGVPDNNMLLIRAQMIKSCILQQIFGTNIPKPRITFVGLMALKIERLKTTLEETESWYLKILEIAIKSFGEDSLFAGRSYYNLGLLYRKQLQLVVSILMEITSNENTALLLSDVEEHPSIIDSTSQISEICESQLQKFKNTLPIYLKSKTIYEAVNGPDYFWLVHVYRRLKEVYNLHENPDNFESCESKVRSFEAVKRTINKIHKISVDDISDCLRLEKFKAIVNENENSDEK